MAASAPSDLICRRQPGNLMRTWMGVRVVASEADEPTTTIQASHWLEIVQYSSPWGVDRRNYKHNVVLGYKCGEWKSQDGNEEWLITLRNTSTKRTWVTYRKTTFCIQSWRTTGSYQGPGLAWITRMPTLQVDDEPEHINNQQNWCACLQMSDPWSLTRSSANRGKYRNGI